MCPFINAEEIAKPPQQNVGKSVPNFPFFYFVALILRQTAVHTHVLLRLIPSDIKTYCPLPIEETPFYKSLSVFKEGKLVLQNKRLFDFLELS